MATEVWFRNPHDYIRELIEVGTLNIAWDKGLLRKRKIDPIKHIKTFLGESVIPWRILSIGDQGSAEYRSDAEDPSKPVAVYPTWVYGEDSILLEDMIQYPMGEDVASCSDTTVPDDERPRWGQAHRVIVTDLPDMKTGPGRAFLRYLKTLSDDNPKVMIHVHGLYGWKHNFGYGWGAADVEPRTVAQKGRVITPSGSQDKYERMVQKPQWAAAMGFKPTELAEPRNRCIYNIKSALWAGQNYQELFNFSTRSSESVDHESSDNDFEAPQTKSHMSVPTKAEDGDKLLCDTCSLQDKCKYMRIGSVCTVPGAEPVPLSRMFNTRSADDIVDGLGKLLTMNATRLEKGIKHESIDGEMDPEVSRMMGQVFDQGVKLAKLMDPGKFAGGAKVQVNVGTSAAGAVAGASPREFVAAAVRELVANGIPRENITEQMIAGVLEGMVNPDAATKSIQGTAVEVRDERY